MTVQGLLQIRLRYKNNRLHVSEMASQDCVELQPKSMLIIKQSKWLGPYTGLGYITIRQPLISYFLDTNR